MKNNILLFFIGILTSLITTSSLYVFIKSLMASPPEITAAIIGALGALAIGFWTQRGTKTLEINSRHFIEKRGAYIIFINLLFELFNTQRNGGPLSQEEMTEALMKFKRELMIWGDQKIIKTLESYERLCFENSGDIKKQILTIDKILREIRKDLGHRDNQLKDGDLVLMFIKAEDKDKLFN
ncbi:hypothetical protein [Micavibrio aeruginosavorus]|nr:hypothetical protein [Micavibrio aeruginosavorus]